jgi:hypothetical protein
MQKPTTKQRGLLQHYKKTLCCSQNLFEIAIGTLLGDASIQTQNGGKTFRLKYSQSDRHHREYLFHLHQFSIHNVVNGVFKPYPIEISTQ